MLSRTHDQIAVSYSTDGGRIVTPLPDRPEFHLDAGNGFTFSGEFALLSPAPDDVVLLAESIGPWANGAIGEPRTTPPLRVPDCAASNEAAADASGGDGSAAAPSRSADSLNVSARCGDSGQANLPVGGHETSLSADS